MKIRKIIIIFVIAIILMVFFIDFQFSINLPFKIFNAVTIIPVKISSIIFEKTTGFFSLIIHIKDLKNENNKLRSDNLLLISENIKLKEVIVENDFLRKALNLEKKHEYNLIPARVVGKDPAMFSDSVLIDIGEDYEIKKDMAVISFGGALLGIIKEVDFNHSQVMPIMASGESVNVIAQESRIEGILKGEFGLSLIFELIPQDKDVKIGETIITSGINDRIPRGILVGYVQDVEGEPNDPFKKAKIRAESRLNREEWVYIVK